MKTEIQPFTIPDIQVMAQSVSKSRLFGMDEAQAFTMMLLAQAEGIHPIKAVQRYNIVLGKPSMKSDAMLADFQKIGGTCKWLTASNDREKAEAVFTHPLHAPEGQLARFDMADAKKAGLDGKDNWKNYPSSMMRARVVSIAIRMIAPGIVAGLHTPEEVGDFGNPIEVEARPVPEHHAINHDNQTGHGSGAYAEPDDVKAYQAFINAKVEEVNSKWLDHITDHTGEVLRDAPGEIIRTWELSGHLLKWAKAKEWVRAPDDVRAGSRDRYAAVAWEQHKDEFLEEATVKCRKCWTDARADLRKKSAKATKTDQRRESPEVLELQAEGEALDELLTTEAGARG